MKKRYNIMEVLTLAIAVDEAQGFIKSGFGYYNHTEEKEVLDNKTAIARVLGDHPKPPVYNITDEHRKQAQELKDYFDGVIVMKKLTGSVNGFEDSVGKIINGTEVDNYGVSVLASLPNSLRIQKQRDDMDEFYDEKRHISEYIGSPGKRSQFKLFVKDVKYIAKYNIHLVTCVEGGKNLIKFFWNKDPDVSELIVGKTMIVTGFVKEQSVSKFSKCKETVINRVKITEST